MVSPRLETLLFQYATYFALTSMKVILGSSGPPVHMPPPRSPAQADPPFGYVSFDPRIVIADVAHLTSKTDTILNAAVLEGTQSGLIVVQIFESLGVGWQESKSQGRHA